jgi:hypothetical protein
MSRRARQIEKAEEKLEEALEEELEVEVEPKMERMDGACVCREE